MGELPRVVVVSTTAISPSTASGFCLQQLFSGKLPFLVHDIAVFVTRILLFPGKPPPLWAITRFLG